LGYAINVYTFIIADMTNAHGTLTKGETMTSIRRKARYTESRQDDLRGYGWEKRDDGMWQHPEMPGLRDFETAEFDQEHLNRLKGACYHAAYEIHCKAEEIMVGTHPASDSMMAGHQMKRDAEDVREIGRMIMTGRLSDARLHAELCDTEVRESLPSFVWTYIRDE
tara:strand:- start:18156 stop:18653 length:498 start_codon:yes stop_codon:yes gene_type:complete